MKSKRDDFLIYTSFITMIWISLFFLLQKGVEPFEHMDNCEKFSETSLPEKVSQVPSAIRAWRALCPNCSDALRVLCPTCFRVSCFTYFVPYAFSCLTCLVPCIFSWCSCLYCSSSLTCLRCFCHWSVSIAPENIRKPLVFWE